MLKTLKQHYLISSTKRALKLLKLNRVVQTRLTNAIYNHIFIFADFYDIYTDIHYIYAHISAQGYYCLISYS